MRATLSLVTLCLLPTLCQADAPMTGFSDQVHTDADGKQHGYVLFVPHSYDAAKPTPLVLFLHGAGETGTDGRKQAEVGLGKAIRADEKAFPFVAVFPQAAPETAVLQRWHGDQPNGKRALAILAEIQKRLSVDAKRVYLTGLSMGGYGTWDMAARYPDKWAAIIPICGGGNPGDAGKIKDIPCWAFHGDQDTAVPVERSREMVRALHAAGGGAKYTEYAGVGHLCWDQAYATPGLWDWLLSHSAK